MTKMGLFKVQYWKTNRRNPPHQDAKKKKIGSHHPSDKMKKSFMKSLRKTGTEASVTVEEPAESMTPDG